jgi:hypothetical protein
MEQSYKDTWKDIFSKRLTLGRLVQSSFGKDNTTSLFLKAANHLPFVRKALVRGTAGKPF